eukprot:COSAG02_NODE_51_length_44689_cov_29.477361_7_plen_63_part_00
MSGVGQRTGQSYVIALLAGEGQRDGGETSFQQGLAVSGAMSFRLDLAAVSGETNAEERRASR